MSADSAAPVKRKIFEAANLRVVCDERCPIYYCEDPCRVMVHVEKYSKIISRGYGCSVL